MKNEQEVFLTLSRASFSTTCGDIWSYLFGGAVRNNTGMNNISKNRYSNDDV